MALNVQVLAALNPFLAKVPGFSSDVIGDAIAIGWGASALSSLLLLPVVDRIGRRLPLLIGLLGFAIASGLHLYVDTPVAFTLVRAVGGLFGGAVFTVASAAVADLVPYARRGLSLIHI